MKLYILEGHSTRLLDMGSRDIEIIGVYSSLEKAREAQDVVGLKEIPKLRPIYDIICITEVELDKMPDEVVARVVWD